MKNKKGFTLVELIVVIAILGILSLFLVPSFIGYADDAKKQVAEANTRTVWSAAQSILITREYDSTISDDNFETKVKEKLGSSFTGYLEAFVDSGVLNVTYQTGEYTCQTLNGTDFNCSTENPNPDD